MSWSDIFIPSGNQTSSEQQANADRLNAEYQARLERRRQEGTLGDNYVAANPITIEDQDAAAAAGFREGLAEGPGLIHDTLAGLFNGIFKAIPWQLWLALLVVAFFYLGGFAVLQRRIARL